jgi:hypothetical protein
VGWGLAFTALVLVGFFIVFARIRQRSQRMGPILDAAALEPVLFRERAQLRVRYGTKPWGDVKTGLDRDGIEVVVHPNHIEIGFRGRGRGLGAGLGCEWVLENSNTTASRGKVGWLGTSLAARESVILHNTADDPRGEVHLAIASADPNDLLHRLISAGVRFSSS